jgi:hypothetical protein
MENDKQPIRFDFPPGAGAKEIAEALNKAREELRARKKAAASAPQEKGAE